MFITALPCSLCTVFYNTLWLQRPCPPTIWICYKHINERETTKTCLANHKGSISHHIMPLVINSLEGRHTHRYTHTCKHTHIADKSNFKKPVVRHFFVPGLKSGLAIHNKYTIHSNTSTSVTYCSRCRDRCYLVK